MSRFLSRVAHHAALFLLWVIIFNLSFGTYFASSAHAQSRRGVFVQDEGGAASDSFGEVGAPGGEEEDEFDVLGTGQDRRSRRLRSPTGIVYQVHVLGEVKRPGTYRVTPSMRVTDALQMAGGILKNGSERFISFRRPGQKQGRTIDLFAYKILGQISQNPYLQDNNTIFVPLKKRAVEIEGPVRRPGVYELKNERTLYDIIELAGGYSVGANRKGNVKIIRFREGHEKEIINVPDTPQDMRSAYLEDGDVIVVPHKFLTKHKFDYNVRKLPNDNLFYPSFEDKVFVIGGVKAPGAFPFNQYYSLRQYLTLAGGTTTMAKQKKIKLVRVDGSSQKAPRGEFEGVVNPGDTIVVPEKSVPTAFYYSLLTTVASIGVSAAAIFTR